MSAVLTRSVAFTPPSDRLVEVAPQGSAGTDGASLGVFYLLVLMLLPARMVVAGLPLSLSPANLVALGCCLVWLCTQMTSTLGAAKGRAPVRTALFLWFCSLTATYGLATVRYLPPDELKLADHALVLVLADVGIALALCDGIRRPERLDFVLRTLVFAGAVMGLLGALQFFGTDLTTLLGQLPGLREGTLGGVVQDRQGLRRVASTAGHPIEFGVLCAMLLPIGVHLSYRARALGRPAVGWWVATVLIALGMLFSLSRSALVGLAVSGTILLVGWNARRRVNTLTITALFFAVVDLAVPKLFGTLWSLFANFGQDSSVQWRQHRYTIAETEIDKHLWLGRGVGTWTYPKYVAFDNQWILSTLESGVLGVTALAGMLLAAIWSALRVRRLSSDPIRRDLGLTLAASLSVPVVTAATFDLLAFHIVAGLTFVLIGISGAMLRGTADTRGGVVTGRHRIRSASR